LNRGGLTQAPTTHLSSVEDGETERSSIFRMSPGSNTLPLVNAIVLPLLFAENAVGITVGIVLALGNEAGQLLGKLGEGAAFGLIGGVIVFAFSGGVAL
jgi:hypothetical protein